MSDNILREFQRGQMWPVQEYTEHYKTILSITHTLVSAKMQYLKIWKTDYVNNKLVI